MWAGECIFEKCWQGGSGQRLAWQAKLPLNCAAGLSFRLSFHGPEHVFNVRMGESVRLSDQATPLFSIKCTLWCSWMATTTTHVKTTDVGAHKQEGRGPHTSIIA